MAEAVEEHKLSLLDTGIMRPELAEFMKWWRDTGGVIEGDSIKKYLNILTFTARLKEPGSRCPALLISGQNSLATQYFGQGFARKSLQSEQPPDDGLHTVASQTYYEASMGQPKLSVVSAEVEQTLKGPLHIVYERLLVPVSTVKTVKDEREQKLKMIASLSIPTHVKLHSSPPLALYQMPCPTLSNLN